MLTVETLTNIEQVLTSDCLTIKGSQMLAVVSIIQQVQTERLQLQQMLRATPMPVAPPRLVAVPDSVPEGTGQQ